MSKANERNVKETTQTIQLKLDLGDEDNLESSSLENKKSLIEEKSKETLVSKETLDEGTQTLLDNKKEPKEKLSKFEKRQNRRKKEEALLNMRGIPKYFLLLIVETLFIFLSEMIVKVLIGSFTVDYTILRIFLSSFAFGLILTLLTNNLPNKLRRGILIILDFFIVFYAWLQIGFLNFLGSFMSVGNAEQGTKAIEYILDFLHSYHPLVHTVFIPFIGLIVYFIFERNLTRDGFDKKIPFKTLAVDTFLLSGLGLLGLLYYATLDLDFMQNKYQMVPNKELIRNPDNASIAIRNFGMTMYFILDINNNFLNIGSSDYTVPSENKGNDSDGETTDYTREIDNEAWKSLIKAETNADYKALNDYFYNQKIVDKNEYTGLFEGKNLIMIMLESISEPLFHEEFKEYFPTFYKLYNEGITAVNNYSPMNNCGTGESERTSQTSVYSIETTCTVNTYRKNEYRQALLNIFKDNDYYTSTYHDFNNKYYDRKTFEYKFGATKYFNADDLGIAISSQYSEWPSDYEFMKLALPKFIDEEKFASYMITVTAHTPYIFDSEMGRKNIELFKDTDFDLATKRYLSKAKEADLALEYLLEELEKSGKLDDTVIVIFGDHYPYALSDKSYQAIAPYDISINNEVDRTPFIIYNSETEPEKVSKYTSPMDYTPTLLNLFGLEYDPRLYMGNDIFSDYTDYVLFQDNSWQNANGFYSSSKGEFLPNEGVNILSDEEIIAINKEALNKRQMSELAIKKDYFAYLFKYFDEYKKIEDEKEKDDALNDEEET